MAKNRFFYLLVLLGAGAFFICYNGYLSLDVFALAVALPGASLVLSLPGMLGARAQLSLGEGDGRPCRARKGESLPLRLEVWNATPFSGGRAKVSLSVENAFTGQREQERFVFTPGPGRQVFQHSLSSRACGRVACQVGRLWVCDYLGLFCLPLGRVLQGEQAAYFLPRVEPIAPQAQEPPSPGAEGERYSQTKAGDDPTELFSLREWREGDRLARVHWKLSQKLGRPLVKELGLPLSDHLLVALDLGGDGWEADLLLDALASLSSFLTQGEGAHHVMFWDHAGGALRCRELASREELLPFWLELLDAGPAPLPCPAPAQLPQGATRCLCLCPSPREELLQALQAGCPAARITVVQTQPLPSQGTPFPGAEYTLLRPGAVAQCLNQLTL